MTNVTLTIDDYNQANIHKLVTPIVFLSVMIVFGIPANTVVLLVYRKDYSKSIYKTIIWNLAIVHLAFCVFGIPFNIARMSGYYSFKSEWTCIIGVVSLVFMSRYSTHLLMLLSVYRFMRICFPFRPQWTSKRVKILILGCCGIALLLSLPFFGLSKYESFSIGNNLTAHRCSISMKTPSVFSRIFNYFFLVLYITYTIILMILYSIIGCKMYFQNKHMFRQNSKVKNNAITSRMTKVALAISTVFALSFLPLFLLQIVRKFIDEESLSFVEFAALKIGERLYVLNHVASPYIYGYFDKTLTKRVKDLFKVKSLNYRNGTTANTAVQPTASSDLGLETQSKDTNIDSLYVIMQPSQM